MGEDTEADESDWPDKATDRLEKLRDRFSTWAMAVSSVCVVCAVWMRAPGLDVELPLGGETKVSLNVGYVLALGMPLLLLAYAWTLAPLVALRALQRDAIESASSTPASDDYLGRVRRFGVLRAAHEPSRFGRTVVLFALGTRILVLFVLPPLAFLFIANVYFLDLHVFDASHFESKRLVRLPEHFFGLGSQPADEHREGIRNTRFAVTSHDLEEPCLRKWSAERRPPYKQAREAAAGEEQVGDGPLPGREGAARGGKGEEVCVLDAFPRFVLPLNGWVNLTSLLAMPLLCLYGLRAYLGIGPDRRDGAKAGPRSKS
jgi:hypothetical protein